MTFPRFLALAVALIPALVFAAPVPETEVTVLSTAVVKDGKLIKARVKFIKAGTYWVAGGYVVDYDAKFQFLKGKLSSIKYYEVRKVVSKKDNAITDLEFPIKVLPPLVKRMARVEVFHNREDIPVKSP